MNIEIKEKMTNEKLRQNLDSWAGKAKSGQSRYQYFEFLGIDGQEYNIDLTQDVYDPDQQQNVDPIDFILDKALTYDNLYEIKNQYSGIDNSTGKSFTLRRDYDDKNHYQAVIFEIPDNLTNNQKQEVYDIACNVIQYPDYSFTASNQGARHYEHKGGARPSLISPLHKADGKGNPSHFHAYISDRSLEIKEDNQGNISYELSKPFHLGANEQLDAFTTKLKNELKKNGYDIPVTRNWANDNSHTPTDVKETKEKLEQVASETGEYDLETINSLYDSKDLSDQEINEVVKNQLSQKHKEQNELIKQLNQNKREEEALKQADKTYKNLVSTTELLENTREENNTLKITIEEKDNTINEKDREVKIINSKYNQLQNQLKQTVIDKDNEIDNWKNDYLALEEEQNQLKEDYEATKEQAKEYVEQIKQNGNLIAEKDNRINELEDYRRQAKELQEKVNNLENVKVENARMETTLQYKDSEIDRLKQELNEQKELNKQKVDKKDYDNLSNENNQLKKDLEWQKEITNDKVDKETYNELEEIANNKVDPEEHKQVKNDLSKTKEKLTKLSNSMEKLKEQNETLKKQLENQNKNDNSNDNDKTNDNSNDNKNNGPDKPKGP